MLDASPTLPLAFSGNARGFTGCALNVRKLLDHPRAAPGCVREKVRDKKFHDRAARTSRYSHALHPLAILIITRNWARFPLKKSNARLCTSFMSSEGVARRNFPRFSPPICVDKLSRDAVTPFRSPLPRIHFSNRIIPLFV